MMPLFIIISIAFVAAFLGPAHSSQEENLEEAYQSLRQELIQHIEHKEHEDVDSIAHLMLEMPGADSSLYLEGQDRVFLCMEVLDYFMSQNQIRYAFQMLMHARMSFSKIDDSLGHSAIHAYRLAFQHLTLARLMVSLNMTSIYDTSAFSVALSATNFSQSLNGESRNSFLFERMRFYCQADRPVDARNDATEIIESTTNLGIFQGCLFEFTDFLAEHDPNLGAVQVFRALENIRPEFIRDLTLIVSITRFVGRNSRAISMGLATAISKRLCTHLQDIPCTTDEELDCHLEVLSLSRHLASLNHDLPSLLNASVQMCTLLFPHLREKPRLDFYLQIYNKMIKPLIKRGYPDDAFSVIKVCLAAVANRGDVEPEILAQLNRNVLIVMSALEQRGKPMESITLGLSASGTEVLGFTNRLQAVEHVVELLFSIDERNVAHRLLYLLYTVLTNLQAPVTMADRISMLGDIIRMLLRNRLYQLCEVTCIDLIFKVHSARIPLGGEEYTFLNSCRSAAGILAQYHMDNHNT